MQLSCTGWVNDESDSPSKKPEMRKDSREKRDRSATVRWPPSMYPEGLRSCECVECKPFINKHVAAKMKLVSPPLPPHTHTRTHNHTLAAW